MQTKSFLKTSGAKIVWVNGRPAEHLPAVDRGTAYGHGVFETISVLNIKPQLWSLHLNRLISGCQRLYIPINENHIQSQVKEFLASLSGYGDGILKIMVTAGSGGRGYGLPTKVEPHVILLWFDPPANQIENSQQGVSVRICETRLARQPLLAGIKHLNRLEQVLAKQELNKLKDDVDEGIMLDTAGCVVEGVMSNLFLVKEGVLITPDLANAGVAGVMREFILSRVLTVEATKISDVLLDELRQADEVFVCNSVFGVWPVVSLAGCSEPVSWSCGGVTRQIQEEIKPYCFSYD